VRLRVVVLAGGCGGRGAAATPLAPPTTQRRFVDFDAALCKVVRRGLFA
jgi:hypothetical protein